MMRIAHNVKSHIKNAAWICVVLLVILSIHRAWIHLYPTGPVYGNSMLPGIAANTNIRAKTFNVKLERHEIYIVGEDPSYRVDEGLPGIPVKMIKRLVGLPGDTLVFDPLGSLTSINGVPVQKSRAIGIESFQHLPTEQNNTALQNARFVSHPYTLKFGGISYSVYETEASSINQQTIQSDWFRSVVHFDYLASISSDNNQSIVVLGDDEYFVLSDNRSIGDDSRHFGPINAKHLIMAVI